METTPVQPDMLIKRVKGGAVVGICNPPLSVGRCGCSAKFPNFVVLKGSLQTSILKKNMES